MKESSIRELAGMIDHSLLHPTLTDNEIKDGLGICKRLKVASACVKPCDVADAAEYLADTDVKVCAVVAFPHGNSTTSIKIAECLQCIEDGAAEIDIVVNTGKVLSGKWNTVVYEIASVNTAVTSKGAILKVIFENDYLEDHHIVKLAKICANLQVAYIKTSTGYGFVKQADGSYNYKGATDHHLKLMHENAGSSTRIKAAGGIRTLDDLLRVKALGVSRVGATATVTILEEARNHIPRAS